MIWQLIVGVWHWIGSLFGSILLWCFLAAVVLSVVELCIYRGKRRRGRT